MEKAILKTLIYSDIFDYPLQVHEIHRWLIGPPVGRAGKKVTLRQLEKALGKLVDRLQVTVYREYYFLPQKNGLVIQRRSREKQSAKYFRKAKMLCWILKIIPWIKLVGISGGLALNNASKKDDIDLFIITGKNRLWISRLLALGLLSLTGQRRKVGEKWREVAGKLCLNILLEEDQLEQKNKDIFVAHEVLQMKVLWQRKNVYSKYLADNSWAFKFLPNWITKDVLSSKYYVLREKAERQNSFHNTRYIIHNTFNIFEALARKFQLWYMKPSQGMERISEGALYFHPEDCRLRVLSKYEQTLKKYTYTSSVYSLCYNSASVHRA